MKNLRTYPFLVSILPIINIFSNNLNELYPRQLIIPVLTLMFLNLIFFRLLSLRYSADVVPILLAFFWCFILYYSFFKGIFLVHPAWHFRIRYLIALWLIVLGLSLFLVLRYIKKLPALNRAFEVFFRILIIIALVKISSFYLLHRSGSDLSVDKSNGDSFSKTDNKPANSPDVYYIIVDGYPNAKILKDMYHFDNTAFLTDLKTAGLKIAENSRSNYATTFLSLASSLNMKYINYLTKTEGRNSNDRKIPYEMITNNEVTQFLKNRNYRFINISSGWGPTDFNPYADVNFKRIPYMNELSTKVIYQSVFADIMATAGSHFFSNYDDVSYSFSKLTAIPLIKGPKFVLAHILAPHDTFIFDAAGKSIIEKYGDSADINSYLKSLIVLNKKITEAIRSIVSRSRTAPVIVLQSDHGSSLSFFPRDQRWHTPSEINLNERLSNFTALFLPKTGASEANVSDSITPVNIFRSIFNSYFNSKFDILKDSSFFSDYDHPYIMTSFR